MASDALADVMGGALRTLPSGCSCDGRLVLVDGLLGGGAGTSDTPAAGVVGGSVLILTGIVGGSRCCVGWAANACRTFRRNCRR